MPPKVSLSLSTRSGHCLRCIHTLVDVLTHTLCPLCHRSAHCSTQGLHAESHGSRASFGSHSRSSHWFRVHFPIVSTPAVLASSNANLLLQPSALRRCLSTLPQSATSRAPLSQSARALSAIARHSFASPPRTLQTYRKGRSTLTSLPHAIAKRHAEPLPRSPLSTRPSRRSFCPRSLPVRSRHHPDCIQTCTFRVPRQSSFHRRSDSSTKAPQHHHPLPRRCNSSPFVRRSLLYSSTRSRHCPEHSRPSKRTASLWIAVPRASAAHRRCSSPSCTAL